MPEPPTKRRRTSANPYLDLEAAVDRDDEREGSEDEADRAFIDDGPEDDNDETSHARLHRRRQQLFEYLQEDGQVDGSGGGTQAEQGHESLLREMLGLDLGNGDGGANPLVVDGETDEDEDEEVVAIGSAPRPLWATLGDASAAVRGALDTWQDDEDERKLSSQDGLYEVLCTPGMEETVVFRIFSWAMQVDASGPTPNHILARWAPSVSSPVHTSNSSGSARTHVVLARSAIANPFIRGRVYIESAKIGYVQRLARRVRGLNPASVRPVPRELLLRPLVMMRHSFPDRTFVRLLDPPCPSATCLIVKDHVMVVPRSLRQEASSSISKFDADTHAMPAPPPDSYIDDHESLRGATHVTDNVRTDDHGFRYFPLKLLGPSSLETYEPSAPEIELLFKYGRLTSRHYKYYMSRIAASNFSAGDRVIFQAGTYQCLIGTILKSDDDGSCSVYIPSQGSIATVMRQELRRHFCVGDRVSTTSDDVTQKLGSRIGWVVNVSDGNNNVQSSIEDRDSAQDKDNAQLGYRADLCVFSPESGKEIIAAHYEFQFEDDSSVSLQTLPTSSPVSVMTIGTVYTLTTAVSRCEYRSFLGIIDEIYGVSVRPHGTEASAELAASVVFSIWDKVNDAPYGYPPNWIETVPDFSDFRISLGQTVRLKDVAGRCGTARITNIDRRTVSLANFTGALKFSHLHTVRSVGPYDQHIGKTVCVKKGPFKGHIGSVKMVNAVGICTVELNVQPIQSINVGVKRLCAVDESRLYMSLVPILALPPRSVTPPAPAPSSDTPSAFRTSSSDIDIDPPQQPGHDCRWLAQTFAQHIPIKLEPINHRNQKMKRPYHFLNAFYDNSGDVPRLMVRVLDRKKERDFPADALKWLPASDVNQTVVRVTGEGQSTLYWTVLVDQDNCQVRQVPSNRGVPLVIFPRLELAQVNGKRT